MGDFGSERDQKYIECYTKLLLTCCLAIGHLSQVVTTFPSHGPTIVRVSNFEPSLSPLFVDKLFPRYRWFVNDEEYPCRASIEGPDTF